MSVFNIEKKIDIITDYFKTPYQTYNINMLFPTSHLHTNI